MNIPKKKEKFRASKQTMCGFDFSHAWAMLMD
jgi:hypothetical protein